MKTHLETILATLNILVGKQQELTSQLDIVNKGIENMIAELKKDIAEI